MIGIGMRTFIVTTIRMMIKQHQEVRSEHNVPKWYTHKCNVPKWYTHKCNVPKWYKHKCCLAILESTYSLNTRIPLLFLTNFSLSARMENRYFQTWSGAFVAS